MLKSFTGCIWPPGNSLPIPVLESSKKQSCVCLIKTHKQEVRSMHNLIPNHRGPDWWNRRNEPARLYSATYKNRAVAQIRLNIFWVCKEISFVSLQGLWLKQWRQGFFSLDSFPRVTVASGLFWRDQSVSSVWFLQSTLRSRHKVDSILDHIASFAPLLRYACAKMHTNHQSPCFGLNVEGPTKQQF